jgi:hypothetical protein
MATHPLLDALNRQFTNSRSVEQLLCSKSYAGRTPPSILIDYSSQWVVVYQTGELAGVIKIKESPVWKAIEAFYGKQMEPTKDGHPIGIRWEPTWTTESSGHHWKLCPGNWWAFVVFE